MNQVFKWSECIEMSRRAREQRSMGCKMWGLALALLLLLLAMESDVVSAMQYRKGWTSLVTGNVFCDQCMKNAVFPYALPMLGAKVSVQCYGAGGSMVASADASTDFFGGFVATFKGVSALDGCKVVMKGSPDSSCSINADSGGKALELKTKFFFSSFYGVKGPMFYKPSAPKTFCPGARKPTPPKPPGFGIPPLPPFPWKEPSTCSADEWMKSEFLCHWKKATPFQTSVGMMFGKDAKKAYGEMNLYTALRHQGQDDLLKQAVAAMMNSYSSDKFGMTTAAVKDEFLKALNGSQQLKWDTAWKLKQANAGWGKGKCMLTPCKA